MKKNIILFNKFKNLFNIYTKKCTMNIIQQEKIIILLTKI